MFLKCKAGLKVEIADILKVSAIFLSFYEKNIFIIKN